MGGSLHKRSTRRVWSQGACLLVGTALGGSFVSLQADPADVNAVDEVFAVHREGILSVGLTNVQGVLFAAGTARVGTGGTASDVAAHSRARAFAMDRLLDRGERGVAWPEGLSLNLRQRLWASLRQCHVLTARFSGIVEVEHQVVPGPQVRVVVALPDGDAQVPEVSWGEILDRLDRALIEHNPRLDVSAFLEVCAPERLPAATDALARRLSRDVGDGARATLEGSDVANPSLLAGFSMLPAAAMTNSLAAFQWLDQYPYSPAGCRALAARLAAESRPRAAQLVRARSVAVFPDWTEADSWPVRLGERFFEVLSEPRTVIPRRLWTSIRSHAVNPPELQHGLAAAVVASYGSLPARVSEAAAPALGEAWRRFASSPPDLAGARQQALQALTEAWSADACNLIGRIYQVEGDHLLALPFLAQAIRADPQHPYAVANLAIAMKHAGCVREASGFAGAARRLTRLDPAAAVALDAAFPRSR